MEAQTKRQAPSVFFSPHWLAHHPTRTTAEQPLVQDNVSNGAADVAPIGCTEYTPDSTDHTLAEYGFGQVDLSDANASTVCVDHRTYGARNYTSVPSTNSLNPKCEWCGASKFKDAESPTPPKCTGCVARQCAESEGATNCTICRAGQYQDAVGSLTARTVWQECTRTPLDKPSARCAMLWICRISTSTWW